MTLRQLVRFVRTRNKSAFNSNLQFQIDAESCGFRIGDLGKVEKTENGYVWDTPHGLLIEGWDREADRYGIRLRSDSGEVHR